MTEDEIGRAAMERAWREWWDNLRASDPYGWSQHSAFQAGYEARQAEVAALTAQVAALEAERAGLREAVYVLVSFFDCVEVRGVYATLEAAQRRACDNAEHELAWSALDRAEASHLGPNLDWWTSAPVDIDGEAITYTITKCRVRALAADPARGEE